MFNPRSRLLYTLLALSLSTGLSACGPAPNTQPANTQPSASPKASSLPPAPSPSPGVTLASLKLHLQADASLAGFATAQAGPFNLCLAQIAKAETKIGTLEPVSRNLTLKDLLAGVDLELAGVPTGPVEGRTTFFNAAGQELGFVSWQANIPAEGASVSVLLKANADTRAGEACPRLEASVSGGNILGAGGQIVSTTPLPNPVTTPTPGPTPIPSPAANAPALPTGLSVVEQTSSSLTLQWEFGSEPVSYKLYLDGRQVQENHTSPNYFRFTGLDASTSYRLGVQAVSAAGGSSDIASLSSSTLASGHSGSGNFSGGGSSRGSSDDSLADSIQNGDEFELNSYTVDHQQTPDVAMNDDGAFVVVWASTGQDGSEDGVYGQRYNSLGIAAGGEFRINAYTTGSQKDPRVAMDADGGFVVAWQDNDQDGSGAGIYAQRYGSNGHKLGSEFLVNTYTLLGQTSPDIAMADTGRFVVVWTSQVEDTNFTAGIYGQLYDSSGNRIDSEFQANTYTGDAQTSPAVAMNDAGDFVVVWEDESQDGSGNSVYGQRYGSDGARADSEFPVNSYTDNNQSFPDVAIDADGDFVVVWESQLQDGSSVGVFGQRFDSGGNSAGSEFSVPDITDGAQYGMRVAMNDDGDFVIVWNSDDVESVGDQGAVRAKRYTADGAEDSSEFSVNTYTTDFQGDEAVALDADGNFIVVWDSYGQDVELTYSVEGRYFQKD